NGPQGRGFLNLAPPPPLFHPALQTTDSPNTLKQASQTPVLGGQSPVYSAQLKMETPGLISHEIKTEAPEQAVFEKDSGPYCCSLCQRLFRCVTHLQAHKENHVRQELGHAWPALAERGLRRSPQTQKNRSDPSNLKLHLRSHEEDAPVKRKKSRCGECGKSFYDLQKHRAVHYTEKPFCCSVCSKAFSGLKDHQRTHTGEKPFMCTLCGKSFSLQGNLKEHERIHSGERPFPCGECEKTFKTARYLRIHQRTHTGEKPYRCTHCGRDFSHLNANQCTNNWVKICVLYQSFAKICKLCTLAASEAAVSPGQSLQSHHLCLTYKRFGLMNLLIFI
uniref:C2H2-type domain-containing protein n=1 Tax=Paramormyrops kingsleyae TaxID=1676925 RepID=A0A3B3QBC3_9TELE